MILQNLKNGKDWALENKNDLLLAVSFFLIAIIAFGLGRLSFTVENSSVKTPIRVEENGAALGLTGDRAAGEQKNQVLLPYVGSKNGSVYHLPGCSGASRIAEENKIWFSSKEEAENLGYRPAKNCEGI
ncbi:MAG: Ada metal-binding domain-containing protein [bacterium]|nr:Ada metal-binding domain-containing protein [bacterium]